MDGDAESRPQLGWFGMKHAKDEGARDMTGTNDVNLDQARLIRSEEL